MERRGEAFQGNRRSRSQLQEQREIYLVDQTRPARRTDLTRPIEEGASNFYGQAARYEDSEEESDSASLLHAVNLNPVPSTQPVEASPSIGAPSQVVPSAVAGYIRANEQQAGDRQESFGVQFRSGNGYQSASGFSSYGMNEPSGGQLRSLPPASVLGPCAAPSRSGACVVPDQQLQSEGQALEDFLRNKLGCQEYERQRLKCYNSFKEAGKDHNTAYTCANLLLVYQIEFDAVKCSQCSGNGIDSEIEHSSDCVVKQAQIRMSNEGSRRQLEPRGTSGVEEVHEGGNIIPQRTSETTHLVVEEVPAEDRIRLSLEDSAEGTSETRRETAEPQTVSGENFQTAVVTQQGENFQTAVVTQQGENFQTVRVTQQGPTGDSETTQTKSLGINTALPKHPNYATVTLRLATYNGWPDSSSQTPQELSDAGFYYAGFGDCVRCFYCGKDLRHWARDDNPWIEHARWSRNCVYLRQQKGEEFLNLVQSALQYSQDNNTQTNEATGNESASKDIENILQSDAAKSALEMGYPVQMIKRAIEEILRENGNAKITAQNLVDKVLDIQDSEHTTTVKTVETGASGNGSVKAKSDTKALMNATICRVCRRETISVTQLLCGHIICLSCSQKVQEDKRCKLCGQEVVDLWPYDPSSKSYRL